MGCFVMHCHLKLLLDSYWEGTSIPKDTKSLLVHVTIPSELFTLKYCRFGLLEVDFTGGSRFVTFCVTYRDVTRHSPM
jgi:hypothetical protein